MIADAVDLGAALEYVERIGIETIAQYEHALLVYGMRELGAIPGVRLIGTVPDKASVLSFVLAGHSTEEVGRALSRKGIAVRAGHHCAQPILRRFGAGSHGASVAGVLQHVRGNRLPGHCRAMLGQPLVAGVKRQPRGRRV
jgi:selenocysteine lyase/cysteine desulfurase